LLSVTKKEKFLKRCQQTVTKLVPHVARHGFTLENYYKKFILGLDVEESPKDRGSTPKVSKLLGIVLRL
jgi:hypothetical protein